MGCDTNLQLMTVNLFDDSDVKEIVSDVLYPVDNLKLQALSSKWRSVDATDQVIQSELAGVETVSGFSINGHNLGFESTVKLQLFIKQSGSANTVTSAVTTAGVTDITFVSTHNIDQYTFGDYYVALFDDADMWHIAQVTGWVDIDTIQIAEIVGWTFTIPTSPAFTLREVFSNTENGATEVFGWGEQPWGRGRWYGYDDKEPADYTVMWFDEVFADYAVITLTDPQNTIGYIEAGRLWFGDSFTPTYNMSWGKQMNYQSQTTTVRTRAGSIISDNRPSYRTTSFTLQYLTEAEAFEIYDMLKYPANKSDALLALYPADEGVKGDATTMLGRIMGTSDIVTDKIGHSISINFEESL